MRALELLKEIESTCYEGGQPNYHKIIGLIDANRGVFSGNAYELFTALAQKADELEGLVAISKAQGVAGLKEQRKLPDMKDSTNTDFHKREAEFRTSRGTPDSGLAEMTAQFRLNTIYAAARIYVATQPKSE